MMRSLLVWVVYGLIPNSGGFVRRESDWEADAPAKSLFWTLVTILAMLAWLVLLMYLSVVWNQRLDVHFVTFSQWGEQIMLGKKNLFNPSSFIRYNGGGLTISLGNGREPTDSRAWKENHDAEMGVKA
jgi:hypothetical protein